MKRKPTVISCAIKNFLLAMMLSMLVGQLNITIDSAIVSNFISTDAMAAVNLCMPVNLIVSALTTLLGIGATIIGAQAIGRRDTDAVSAHFSIALQSIAVVGVIVGICSYFYVDDVVRIVCDDPGLSVYVRDYLIVYLTFSVFVILNMTVDEMVCVDGRPKKAAQAVMLSAAVNLVMDEVCRTGHGWCCRSNNPVDYCCHAIPVFASVVQGLFIPVEAVSQPLSALSLAKCV